MCVLTIARLMAAVASLTLGFVHATIQRRWIAHLWFVLAAVGAS